MRTIRLGLYIPHKPASEIYAALADFGRYPELCDAVRDVAVTEVSENHTVSQWEVSFRAGLLRWTEEDGIALRRAREAERPIIAVVNKIDRVRPRGRLLPYLSELHARDGFLDLVPVSAQKGDNLAELVQVIARALPPGPAGFPTDQLTDRSQSFRIAETIREKLTLELVEELPYGVAVEIEQIDVEPDGRKSISAAIWVDRAGQKPIVIGAKGERLRRVGRAARLELNRLFGERFHLNLWVKVREGWADDARALHQLGVE